MWATHLGVPATGGRTPDWRGGQFHQGGAGAAAARRGAEHPRVKVRCAFMPGLWEESREVDVFDGKGAQCPPLGGKRRRALRIPATVRGACARC